MKKQGKKEVPMRNKDARAGSQAFGAVRIQKEIGETPLEALERFRTTKLKFARPARHALQGEAGGSDLADMPMTYAGRLDPMASGELLILIGDECKKKDKYLKMDKEYELEILFGFETDTYDILGLLKGNVVNSGVTEFDLPKIRKIVASYCESCPTTFSQEYPAFSSKTVKGKPLHEYARQNLVPDERPVKNVTIYSCEIIRAFQIKRSALLTRIIRNVGKVKGDFRQVEILDKWKNNLGRAESGGADRQPSFPIKIPSSFPVIKIKVKCSSGTYMRSLAHEFGRKARKGAVALSIKRTAIGIGAQGQKNPGVRKS